MSDAARALQDYLDDAIPLVRAMQVEVRAAGPAAVVLHAPLAPNRNHQSTAFGGSVAGLATLACWGWLWTVLQEGYAGIELVVAHSEIDYLKPVTTGLVARCDAPPQAAQHALLEALARRGRGRLALAAAVEDEAGVLCAQFTGRFVADRRRP